MANRASARDSVTDDEWCEVSRRKADVAAYLSRFFLFHPPGYQVS